MNDAISYSELRENLKKHLDTVCADSIPLLVKRRKGEDVVIVSKEDYDSMEETLYLMRSKANAKRLLEALIGNKKTRRTYRSIQELEDEFGI